MCRHLVYLGPPRSLASLLHEPAWSLERQSYEPRRMSPGARMNADGWGVGWWDHEQRPEPARYRSAAPLWADQAFRSAAELARAASLLAAVRAASPGLPVVETASAPFAAGPWLFSLNGFVTGFAGTTGELLRRQVSVERAAAIQGPTDSEVLFALVLDRLDRGATPAAAVVDAVAAALACAPGRLNLLLSDGTVAIATTWGASLFALVDAGMAAGGVLVASEPLDDDERWQELPDRHAVSVDRAGVTTHPLDLPGAPC